MYIRKDKDEDHDDQINPIIFLQLNIIF